MNNVFVYCEIEGTRLAFLGLEDDVLDRFYLRRRTAKAALNQVSIHVGHAPFLDRTTYLYIVR